MGLFPQRLEENAVAARVEQLGAGLRLKRTGSAEIRKAVQAVLNERKYRENAQRLKEDIHVCGGASQGADFIERVIENQK